MRAKKPAGRPGPRRGWRVFRNLLVAALMFGALGGFLWVREGYPLPTAELGLRRLERQNLLAPSEIVWTAREGERLDLWEGTAVWMDQSVAVGVRDGLALVGRAQGGWTVWGAGLSVFPVGEGTSPVPLPRTTLSGIREEWDGETPYGVPVSAGPMLFLQMPEEAVRGTLEIWEEQPGEDGARTAPLECRLHPLEAGIWLAALEAEVTAVDAWQPYLGAPYTLRLYGEDGGLLLEQRGTIPEEL